MAESSSNTASLGCGTLIFIALIVMIFGNQNDDLAREVRGLRADVQSLADEVGELRKQQDAEALPIQVEPGGAKLDGSTAPGGHE
jgi:hypothetical protein